MQWHIICPGAQKIFPMEDFRTQFADYLSRTQIPSNAPKVESDKLWLEVNDLVHPNIPKQLFRFRTCNLDNFISFEQSTISVCTASLFKDKYDSLVYVNREKIYKIFDNLIDSGTIDAIYGTTGEDGQILSMVEEQFGKELADTLKKINSELPEEDKKKIKSKEFYHALLDGIAPIIQEHITYMQRDRTTKIACFTEDIRAKRMWDTYADGYTGFALEYDLNGFVWSGCGACPDIASCNKIQKNFTNVYPVIYSTNRYDATENVINIIFSHLLTKIGAQEMLLPIDNLFFYKSYLYKSIEAYSQENEWRMICRCPGMANQDYACIPDRQSIKAIYYGPNIEARHKDHLRLIAQARGIDEYDVSVDIYNPSFELKITRLERT